MNKKIFISTALITLAVANNAVPCQTGCCPGCGQHCNIAQDIDSQFKKMEDWGDRVQRNISKMFREENVMNDALEQKLCVYQEKDRVIITATLGKGVTKFNVPITPHRITIEIPEIGRSIVISYNNKTKFLSMATESLQKKEKKEKGKPYTFRSEHQFMQRGMTLKDSVDLEKTKVSYKDGQLTISIPKIIVEKPKPKKLEVKFE